MLCRKLELIAIKIAQKSGQRPRAASKWLGENALHFHMFSCCIKVCVDSIGNAPIFDSNRKY